MGCEGLSKAVEDDVPYHASWTRLSHVKSKLTFEAIGAPDNLASREVSDNKTPTKAFISSTSTHAILLRSHTSSRKARFPANMHVQRNPM